MWDDVPLQTGGLSVMADYILPNDVSDMYVKMGEVVMLWEKGEDFDYEIVGCKYIAGRFFS